MKRLLIAVAFSTLTLNAMRNGDTNKNDIQLQNLSDRVLQEEDTDITIEPINPTPKKTTIKRHIPHKKKDSANHWSTKKLFVAALVASQTIGLTTDVLGLQESQKLGTAVAPIIAYPKNYFDAHPHKPGCIYQYYINLSPRPDAPMQNEGCLALEGDCDPECPPCIVESCPPWQEYLNRSAVLFTSQIIAIEIRAATILGILIGSML